MPASAVVTLEMTPAGPVRRGDAESLAEASAGLPAGAYTSLRTYGGRGIVRFEAHARRLEESARRQGHEGSLELEAARRLISAALRYRRALMKPGSISRHVVSSWMA